MIFLILWTLAIFIIGYLVGDEVSTYFAEKQIAALRLEVADAKESRRLLAEAYLLLKQDVDREKV